jgi:hypothetical protein
MPSLLHCSDLTPDERFRELARLLAVGILRLNTPALPLENAAPPTTKTHSEFDTNELAVLGEKSVTVHAG